MACVSGVRSARVVVEDHAAVEVNPQSEWLRLQDPSSGKYYYVNFAKNLTQWKVCPYTVACARACVCVCEPV